MRISPEKIDEIHRAVDIVEVVSDYVRLKKRGANFWGLSPFVKEKTPSFAVNPVKGIYKCFSSGKGGSAIGFIMELEGMTYPEALRFLAQKYNIELPEEKITDEQFEARKDRTESLYIVNEFAANFYHEQLLHSEKGKLIALSYFKERGISEATIQDFRLGYAPDAWEEFSQAALAKQYQADYLVDAGLSIKSEKTGNLIDRFRDRVMFPIANVMGKVVGFGGRVLGKKDKEAKYINTPETEIYHKSNVLFGLSAARNAIREKNQVILTEGYMDVLALYQAGLKQSVASSGTALTEEQVRLLRRFTKNVMLIYDGDSAGIKAALRGIDILLADGLSVKVLILPDNHDPDSYLKAFGVQAFEECMTQNAQDCIDFKLTRILPSQSPTPQEQTQVIRDMADTLARIPDTILQEMYVRHIAGTLAVSEELLHQAMGEKQQEIEKQEAREEQKKLKAKDIPVVQFKNFHQLPTEAVEREILRVLLNYHDLSFTYYENQEEKQERVVDYAIRELEGLPFENPALEQLKSDVFASYLSGDIFQISMYLDAQVPELGNLASEFLTFIHSISDRWKEYDPIVPGLDKSVTDAIVGSIDHYKRRRLIQMIEDIKQQLKTVTDEAEMDRLMEEYVLYMQLKTVLEKRIGIEGATMV